MKLFFAALIALLLTGCAAPVYKHEIAGLPQSESLQFTDLRPQQESEQKLFSALITSDAYATYRYSTLSLDPSAVRLFKHKIYEKFSQADKPVDVKVYHFVSYMNMQSSFRRSVLGGALGGAIGAGIATGTQNYNADFKTERINRAQFDATEGDNEYTRSFFSEQENPAKAPLFIVYIDADINGKRSFMKGLAPATRSDGQNPYLYAVENTIKAFLAEY